MLDPELRQRPPHLREPLLVHLLARLRRVKIIAAAIGVEGRKQPLRRDRLLDPAKARRRSFLLDQEDRQYPAGRVIHRHDEAERRPFRQPGVGRGVLNHQHARQRPPLPPPAMRPAPLRFRRQTARLQNALRPRVGPPKLAPVGHRRAEHGFMEVLGREVEIARAELFQHPLDLVDRRAAPRRTPAPAINDPFRPFRLVRRCRK